MPSSNRLSTPKLRRTQNPGSEHSANSISLKLFCRASVARATAQRCSLGVGRIVPSSAAVRGSGKPRGERVPCTPSRAPHRRRPDACIPVLARAGPCHVRRPGGRSNPVSQPSPTLLAARHRPQRICRRQRASHAIPEGSSVPRVPWIPSYEPSPWRRSRSPRTSAPGTPTGPWSRRPRACPGPSPRTCR